MFQLFKLDPVYTVGLRNYLYNQVVALQQSVGAAKFQDLMSTVDIETMQQVQYYLQSKAWVTNVWKIVFNVHIECVDKKWYESERNKKQNMFVVCVPISLNYLFIHCN